MFAYTVFIRKQLRQHCVNFKLNINEKEPCLETADILKCIVSGLFAQAAQLQSDGTYKTVRNREHDRLTIHPSSVLSEVRPPWIVYNEMV
jgi:ATP-dependent RNA helicase DDX35